MANQNTPREAYPDNWNGCRNCEYLNKGSTCEAFPQGIPFMFANGSIPHIAVVPGQELDYVWQQKGRE